MQNVAARLTRLPSFTWPRDRRTSSPSCRTPAEAKVHTLTYTLIGFNINGKYVATECKFQTLVKIVTMCLMLAAARLIVALQL